MRINVTPELIPEFEKLGINFSFPGMRNLARGLLFNGPVAIRENASLIRVTMDAYCSVQFDTVLTTTTLGRYCTIADGVKTGLGIHYPLWLSATPAFCDRRHFRPQLGTMPYPWKVKENGEETTEVWIGNDVWMGCRAMTASCDDIHIGDGAIVGAGAVVTHDVPPYAIVGGAPARIVRMRFNDRQIESLLKIQWWQYDLPRAIKNGLKIPVKNIDDFIAFMEDTDPATLPRIPDRWTLLRPQGDNRLRYERVDPGKVPVF